MTSAAMLATETFEQNGGLGNQGIVGEVALNEETEIPTYFEAFPPLPERALAETASTRQGVWGKIRPLRSSNITQVFHVPLEERKYKDMTQFGEGEQGKICLEIMHKTGAHIELSLSKDQGLSIMVTGKQDAVMKARKDIVTRLQTQATATVGIPKEHHRFIIGRNGEKMQDLELKTATKIQIPRPDDASNQIKITGTKEGIEKARHEIQLISAEQDKRAVERVSIDKVFHPFITGAFNKVVNELMSETGTRINIPPPSVGKDEIVITGEKEAVSQAAAKIRHIYEQKKRKTTNISVEVKKSQHKYIIGPKGNTLQEIMEQTGVSVEIPALDSNSETIILRGEQDKLGPALTHVYAKANSVACMSVHAPAWLHRFVIGKKGQNISRITQSLPKVHIEFTDGEDNIMVEGPTEEVHQAQAQLEEIVKDLCRCMDYNEIQIEQKFHRHLIGKNGANINRIKEQYKVFVRIPPDNEKNNLIRIEGDPQGVQQAMQELLEMSNRMENERTKDLIFEHKYHRTIIGQKGEKIKEVRDKFPEVIINFPDPSQKSDIVQLRGPKNEVEKCAKYMQKFVGELIENNYSISVPIFKQFHKNVIGKGGVNIKKIREETNTKIDLPTENSNSEVIVITGRKENCEAARDKVLSVQKEQTNIKELEVTIPAKLHNSLIGAKGRLVRSIMEECGGVHIHFPSEGSGSDKVTIRGSNEEVERARRQLMQVAEEKQVNSCMVEIRAKPEYHRFLIGRGGSNIRKVRDRTGARIIFPAAEDKDQELITIVGKEASISDAQQELEELIRNLDNVIEDAITVDQKHHRHFIARRGQVLRDLAEEYGGVTVSFPRTGVKSDRVVLKGAKDCVEAAKKRILEVVEDLDAQVILDCVIPQKFHRVIMGAKGFRVQQITRDHDVQIKFPEREDSQQAPSVQQDSVTQVNGEVDSILPNYRDVIVISGRQDKCDSAKEALMALVPITRDMEIPFELHRYIIGQKGTGIRRLMEEYGVNIAIPPPEEKSNVIKVMGVASNVERAEKGLMDRAKELQAEQENRVLRSFKLSVNVDTKYHPKIIGRKGAIITEIRKKHDVNIQFPDKGDENQNVITITGYESNTLAARDDILKIVSNFEEMISEDIKLDTRVHSRLIGSRGKVIRRIMDEYKVEIRFPQTGAEDPNIVTVIGLPENVDNAIDHLQDLEDTYMMDVVDFEQPPSVVPPVTTEQAKGDPKGFMVRNAPWDHSDTRAPDMTSSEEFPSFGAAMAPKATVWGPKKF
uniref:vigilin isoform X2 n=1 Tax=Myxine glutinosa TaxID=7769 RepID=UPI00358DE364